MKPAAKWVQAIVPAAILDNTSATAVVIDTLGFDYMELPFCLGATDIAMTALYLQESDDNSTWANVSGTVFGTATDVDGVRRHAGLDLAACSDHRHLLLLVGRFGEHAQVEERPGAARIVDDHEGVVEGDAREPLQLVVIAQGDPDFGKFQGSPSR